MCRSGRDRGGSADGSSGCSCGGRRGSRRDDGRITGGEVCGATVDGVVGRIGKRD